MIELTVLSLWSIGFLLIFLIVHAHITIVCSNSYHAASVDPRSSDSESHELLLALLVLGTLVKVISITLTNTLSAHAMGTEAARNPPKSGSLSISLSVNIRCHCKLLLLRVLI